MGSFLKQQNQYCSFHRSSFFVVVVAVFADDFKLRLSFPPSRIRNFQQRRPSDQIRRRIEV